MANDHKNPVTVAPNQFPAVNMASRDPSESVFAFIMRHPSLQFWSLIAASQIIPMVYYIRSGLNQDHFQYLPFLYLSIGYLFYQRWDKVIRAPQRTVSHVFLALGLATMIAAAFFGSTWLVGVSFALCLTSFLSSSKERNGLPMTYLGAVLLLSIRLPLARTAAIVTRLQLTVTDFSANVLDGMRVPNATDGTLIQLPSKDLLVAEACSGIQSLFTILFFALLMIAYHRRRSARAVILVGMAIVIAVFGNALRILTIAMAEYLFGFDLAVGWLHSALGYVALAFAAALLFACDDLLTCVVPSFRRISVARWRDRWPNSMTDGTQSVPPSSTSESISRHAITGRHGVVPLVFGLCGIALIGHLAMRSTRPRASFDEQGIFLDKSTTDGIVASVGMQPISHSEVRNGTASEDDRLGKNADIYQCRLMGIPGQLVVSQPYVGWHELTYCYRAIGWKMIQRFAFPVGKDDPPVIYATFLNESGQHGLLAFTGLNADGTIPRTYGGMSRVERWLSPFIPTILDDPTETEGEPQTAMVQYWTVADQPIGESGILAICERVAETRRQMKASLNLEDAT